MILRLFYPLVICLILSGLLAPLAEALDVPPDAGLVQQHAIKIYTMRKAMPWLDRPITDKDLAPPEPPENLIEYRGAGVHGSIVVPGGEGRPKIQVYKH